MKWKCSSFEFDLDEPVVMGILNVTPDSFSDGGLYRACDAALAHAHEMLDQGAAIIDVGGESTRPGSAEVTSEEERARVVPVVKALAAEGIAVSVDTRHALVARESLAAGACIINDVCGMRDAAMRATVAASDAGVVIMHMQGEPGSMQANPVYTDVVAEVEASLLASAHALEQMGVAPERICLDPGCGFGKTQAHNQALLQATPRFAALGYPLMVAVSRKSYIAAMTGIDEATQRDEASALCAAAACESGARIIRAHNAAETMHALRDSRRALIGMGSNEGDRCAYLDAAVKALRALPHTWVTAVSSYYESEPAYYEDQQPFANAVAVVQTTLAPEALLEGLHAIENSCGRVRSVANGPRTLDLDIEDYEGVVSNAPELTLPHPRLLERAFVVTPCLEVLEDACLADGMPLTADAVTFGAVRRVLREASVSG